MKQMMGAILLTLLVAGIVEGQEKGSEPANITKALTGQCHCGSIKYEVKGSIIKSSYCDCRGCQKATGTLKAPFVTILRNNFKITTGNPTEFQAKSGVKCDCHGVWHFCPNCGTQLFWKGNKGDKLDIFVGTLDDTTVFLPKK